MLRLSARGLHVNPRTRLRLAAALLCTPFLSPALAGSQADVAKRVSAPPAAAAPPSTPSELAEAAPPPADLTLHNRDVATLRAVVLGFAPEDRVERAETRLLELLERSPQDEVEVLPLAENRVISLNTRGVFTLTPGDLDPLACTTLRGGRCTRC